MVPLSKHRRLCVRLPAYTIIQNTNLPTCQPTAGHLPVPAAPRDWFVCVNGEKRREGREDPLISVSPSVAEQAGRLGPNHSPPCRCPVVCHPSVRPPNGNTSLSSSRETQKEPEWQFEASQRPTKQSSIMPVSRAFVRLPTTTMPLLQQRDQTKPNWQRAKREPAPNTIPTP